MGADDERSDTVAILEEHRKRRQEKGSDPQHLVIGVDTNPKAMGALPSHIEAEKPGDRVMSDPPTREEIRATIDASEARMETKIVKLEGKIDLVLSKLDIAKIDNHSAKNTTWTVGGIVIGVIVGVAALAAAVIPASFSGGATMRGAIREEVRSAIEQSQAKSDDPAKANERRGDNPR